MNEIEKLLNLGKSINRGGYHRCTVCNAVSNESIETEPGDYKPNMSFVHDPNDPVGYICIDCSQEIMDLMVDYEEMDREKEEGE